YTVQAIGIDATIDDVIQNLVNAINADTALQAITASAGFVGPLIQIEYEIDYFTQDPINAYNPALTDSYLLPNQLTNMSFLELQYEDIESLIYVDVLSCAYGLDNQNPPNTFFPYLPDCTIIQSIPPIQVTLNYTQGSAATDTPSGIQHHKSFKYTQKETTGFGGAS